MPKLSGEGTAGFFEDIPVLIVVLIATGIFLYSLVHAYVVYLDNLEHERMKDELMGFKDAVRSYEGLMAGSEEGVFSGDKVLSLSHRDLEGDFDPSALGYHYQVSIIDTSGYRNSLEYTRAFASSEPPARGDIYSTTTSVLIIADNSYHAGQLVVTIWS
jgi:hypothetical protein